MDRTKAKNEPLKIQSTPIKKSNHESIITETRFKGEGLGYFDSTKETSVIIPVSIKYNQKCTGKELEQSILYATSNFSNTTVVICDQLSWHNLRQFDGKDDESLLKKQAENEGSEFIKTKGNFHALTAPIQPFIEFEQFYTESMNLTASNIIDSINTISDTHNLNFQVYRWHDWLQLGDENFSNREDETIALIKSESSLQKSLTESCKEFAKTHLKKEKTENQTELMTLWKNRSEGYFPDEIFNLLLRAAYLGYNFLAYPGKPIPIFKTSLNFFIRKPDSNTPHSLSLLTDEPKHILNWLEISFVYESKKVIKADTGSEKGIPSLSIASTPFFAHTNLQTSTFDDESALCYQIAESFLDSINSISQQRQNPGLRIMLVIFITQHLLSQIATVKTTENLYSRPTDLPINTNNNTIKLFKVPTRTNSPVLAFIESTQDEESQVDSPSNQTKILSNG